MSIQFASPAVDAEIWIPEQARASRALRPTDWTISHDFMFAHGGAERVTAALAQQVLPGSSVTAIGGDREVANELGIDAVKMLFPRLRSSNYVKLAPLYPGLLQRREAVPGNLLASSYGFSHHLRAEGKVVVYCHSPLRQVWSGVEMYRGANRSLTSTATSAVGPYMRMMDRRASSRARTYVANSQLVADRIKQYYGIDPVAVVAPPVDPRFHYTETNVSESYVWAGRIVEPYKKLEMTIEAFRGTSRQLVVAGAGRDEERLRSLAPDNVKFIGHCSTDALASLYRSARALIFPSEDDFGMVPVEAMACGAPIIAYRGGGALETVAEDRTGVFFDSQTASSLSDAILHFEGLDLDRADIAHYASQWSLQNFSERMRAILGA